MTMLPKITLEWLISNFAEYKSLEIHIINNTNSLINVITT